MVIKNLFPRSFLKACCLLDGQAGSSLISTRSLNLKGAELHKLFDDSPALLDKLV